MAATMTKIGVVGAGQMGNGIAHVCALAGYSVALHDVSEERIKAGLATIDGNLARQVASGRITEADRKRAIGKIQPALSLDQFSDVDLAIESVSENEAVKRKDLRRSLPPLFRRPPTSPPTPPPSPSPASPPPPTGRSASSACTS